jgi:hypothetical protein
MACHGIHSGNVIRNFNKEHRARSEDRKIDDTQSLISTRQASRPTRASGMSGDGRINKLHWRMEASSERPASPHRPLHHNGQKRYLVYHENMFTRFSFSVDSPSRIIDYYSIRDS